jgi:hypothetical protein
MVQGFPWCLNEPKSIGLSNLVAKILCKKHNSDLSDLDSAALDAFNIFREAIRLNDVRGRIKKPALWNVQRFVVDGPLLERWFLKTLINISFGKDWTIGPGTHAAGTPSRELVEIAFGLRKFENSGGLYIAAEAGEQIDSMDRVNITPITEGNNLVAGKFNFRGYRFFTSERRSMIDSESRSQTTCPLRQTAHSLDDNVFYRVRSQARGRLSFPITRRVLIRAVRAAGWFRRLG